MCFCFIRLLINNTVWYCLMILQSLHLISFEICYTCRFVLKLSVIGIIQGYKQCSIFVPVHVCALEEILYFHISTIIIHIRHFSGKIKPRILLALLPKCDCWPYHTILPFFREILPLFTILKKSAISDHIALFSRRLCALESRTCAFCNNGAQIVCAHSIVT